MAVFSSERLLACSPPRKTPSRTHLPVVVPLRFISLPLHGRRRLVVISAYRSPSSSLLEESSDEVAAGEHQAVRPKPQKAAAISDGFIKGLAKSPEMEALAYDYYQKARAQPEYRPDRQTLRLLIRYLLKCRQWDSISALSEDFRALGVFPDGAACARLVGGCIRARKFKLAEALLRAFQAKPTIAAAAFGAAMRGYNKLHMYSSTLGVHEQMRAAGVPPDPGCWCSAMDAHRKLGNTDQVLALFLEMDPSYHSARIYSILCDSLGRSGRAFESLRYFREMTQRGISPDSSSYASLISSFAGIKEAEIAEDLFQEARQKRLVNDPAVFLKLVLMYVETGGLDKTLEVVRAMKELKIGVSDCVFCAVINGHARKGGLRAAVRAYEELISLGCEPGQVSYASAISVYSRLGLLAMAEALFQEMLDKGFDRCVVAYATMVSVYGRSGRVREATRLLARMKEKGCEPNVWVYNSLIDMHGRATNLRQVEKLWKEMRRRRVAPDKVSYTSIIGAYSKAKEFRECVRLYEEFRMTGEKVDRAVAGIMIGVFARSGRIDELVKLLQDVKAEGLPLDERLYASAMNALRDAGLQTQVRWLQESFPFPAANS